jgi:hypothetical protein
MHLSKYFLIAIILIQPHFVFAQDLVIKEVSNSDFNFDEKSQYLHISLSSLNSPKPDAPKWWDKLLGKETNYGLAYIEITVGAQSHSIPIFNYKKSSGNRYDFDSVGVLDGTVGYPIARWIVFKEDAPPKLRVVVKSWEDSKDAEAVSQIINAAALFGGMEASMVEKALNIGDTVVKLINLIWPDKDETNSISVNLFKENLKNQFITLELKSSPFLKEEILTLKLTAGTGRFVNKSFQSALNDYSTEEIAVWREAIIEADQNVAMTGKETLIAQIDKFSKYVSSLNLTYVDKVILLGGAIYNWAQKSVGGVSHDGNHIQFTMSDYRRLWAADWLVLKEYTAYKFAGDHKCNTDACREMATFLSKAAKGDIEAISRFIPQRISFVENGITERFNKEDFLKEFDLYNDSPFKMNPKSVNTWEFEFIEGSLEFRLKDVTYSGKLIRIELTKDDQNFYITRIVIV